LRNSGVLEVVGTAAPGIDDLVVLGKIKQLERSGQWDLILLDAPATGHAITMLTSPAGIASAVTAGPLRTQADEALAFLGDARRCRVMLVTLPEATPVNEVVETAFAMEDRVGVQLGPVVVNLVDEPDSELMNLDLTGHTGDQVVPNEGDAEELWEAARFRVARALLQREQLGRLAVQLPLAQIHLPHLPTADLGARGVSVLAARLTQWLSQSLHARPADL
jgi:arsenite-transporting ATPase